MITQNEDLIVQSLDKPSRFVLTCRTVFSRCLLVARRTEFDKNVKDDVIRSLCSTRLDVYLYLKLSIVCKTITCEITETQKTHIKVAKLMLLLLEVGSLLNIT